MIGRNFFEGVQWTMAYQLQGSMAVYLALSVSIDFTTFHRCIMFVFLIIYSASFDDILEGTQFYTGDLLAELSILYFHHWSIGLAFSCSHYFLAHIHITVLS